jgi:aryl sulfotransferase
VSAAGDASTSASRPERSRRYETSIADSARWDAYRPRAGDIVVATAPKCGTTWTQMLCALLVHGPDLPAPLTRLSPWIDRRATPVEDLMAALEAQTGRRIVKTHTPLDGLPYFEEVSYVFCGRDPRDAFLSMMENMKNASAAIMQEVSERIGWPIGQAFPADPNDFFRIWMTTPMHAWIEDGFPTGSVFGTARSFWPWRGLRNLCFLHYRDLRADPDGELARLADFLGLRPQPAGRAQLLERAGFAAMRAKADEIAPGAHLGDWASNAAFFAKARLGEWREALSPENQALYAELAPTRAAPDLRAWLEEGRKAIDPKDS